MTEKDSGRYSIVGDSSDKVRIPDMSTTPSMRPYAGMTWPMVAYAFVRELPYTMMVVGGTVLGVVFVVKGGSSAVEPLVAVIGPAIVSALGRSRPAEVGQLTGLASLIAIWKGWGA